MPMTRGIPGVTQPIYSAQLDMAALASLLVLLLAV